MVDRVPTAVFCYNRMLREATADDNAVVVGEAVAIRRAGRITRAQGNYLYDEFGDLDRSYDRLSTSQQSDLQNRKGMLFSLELSFLFWYLGEMIVASLLAGMGGGIPSLMFQMLAGLFISVYMEGSVCAFCEAIRKLPAASADTPTPGPDEEEPLN